MDALTLDTEVVEPIAPLSFVLPPPEWDQEIVNEPNGFVIDDYDLAGRMLLKGNLYVQAAG